jgi:hypothetical protein
MASPYASRCKIQLQFYQLSGLPDQIQIFRQIAKSQPHCAALFLAE